MAYLEMYLDESYGESSPNIVIGGFVAHIDQWARFAQAWKRKIVEHYGVPFLHMNELWNSDAVAYRRLKRQQPDEIFLTATSLIRDHVQIGVGCVINQSEFNAVSTATQRSKFGTAYTIGVRYCLSVIAEHLVESLPKPPTMSVFLEDGHRNTNQAIGLLKRARYDQEQPYDSIVRSGDDRFIVWRNPDRDSLGITLGVIDTGTKEDSAPLQAADLLAFAILNEQETRFADVLTELGSDFPVFIDYMSRSELEQTLGALDQEEITRRKQRRRFASVIREMKNTGKNVRKHDTGGYFLDFNELASAEDRVINRFGKGKLTRSLDQGHPATSSYADIEIALQCPHCEALFTLRGFSHQQWFDCPLCRERIQLPVTEH